MKFPLYPHDFQIHSSFSDGIEDLETIVKAAVNSGLKTICVTDHAKGWTDSDGSMKFFENAGEFEDYLLRINNLRKKYARSGISILAGLEVEVTIDGHLRLGQGILDTIGTENSLKDYVDIVVGVIHSESFQEDLAVSMPLERSEKELLHEKNIHNLIVNRTIDIWGHPLQSIHGQFARQFNKRELQLIKEALASRGDLAVEINLNPMPSYEQWVESGRRYNKDLDVMDIAFYEAVADVCTFVVSSDAHTVDQLNRHQVLNNNPAAKYVRRYE